MKELSKVLDVKPVKPREWTPNSKIIESTPHTVKVFLPFTTEEKQLIYKKKILVQIAKHSNYSRNNKGTSINTTTETDITNTEDSTTNINSINTTATTITRWLIKKEDGTILGPFTKSEMKDKLNLTNILVKRDIDNSFVCINKLLRDIPDFLDSDVTEYFKKYDLKTETLDKSLKNKCTVSKFVYKSSNDDLSFSRSREWLKRHLGVSFENLLRKLYGKTKDEALEVVKLNTKLQNKDAIKFIDMIVNESSNYIIVDKDGFIKPCNKKLFQ